MSAPIRFFVGLDEPSDIRHFPRACVSINRLRRRASVAHRPDAEIILDSGAFTEVSRHGGYRHSVKDYAAAARRACGFAPIVVIVAQDYMCEPFILRKTGLTVADHQRLTIERYVELLGEALPVPIMPVIQGYDPADYVAHIDAYGDLLAPGAWCGVGSVCKRNGAPGEVIEVLDAIKRRRPDLRLHGFGVKKTAILAAGVRANLYSADSMAWSYSARRQGRNQHNWREAMLYAGNVERAASLAPEPWQPRLPL
jgi:hypothetical protein